MKAVFYCLLYAILNVSGAALIKWRLRGQSLNQFHEWLNFLLHAQVILAFGIIFGSALVMFKALSTGNFTFIIPVSVGINFILTVLTGYLVFKDQVNSMSFIGFALIISGIFILSINNVSHVK